MNTKAEVEASLFQSDAIAWRRRAECLGSELDKARAALLRLIEAAEDDYMASNDVRHAASEARRFLEGKA